MTEDQARRKAEFDRLYESIPGKNMDRIRRVCEILCYRPNTIHILRMKRPTRFMPDRMLEILRQALAK